MLCPLGVCAALIHALGSHVVSVVFVIIPECSNEIITGLDFLHQHDALIFCREGVLTFDLFSSEDYWDVPGTSNMSGNFVFACTASIPPSTGTWVFVESSTVTDVAGVLEVMTEANRNLLLRDGVISPTSLVLLEHTKIFI